MTILDWLLGSMKKLVEVGVDSPRRDCLVLLEDLLDKDRSWVNAHAEHELTKNQLKILDSQIDRRINREPLAYIRGKAWFYKRFFKVSPDVMIPRPESEGFIELLKELKPKTLVDVGTGSGCLAITAKLEIPYVEVIAFDINEKALKIAQTNAKKHQAQINFLQGSLLNPFSKLEPPNSNFCIMANLPYVPEGLITSPEIEYEPKLALFSGKDGLDHYRKFWQQVEKLEVKPKYILCESLENQHKQLEKLAKTASYKLERTEVLVQLFRLF